MLVSKLYSLFIPVGDGSHVVDDADKLFTCIAGSGNLLQTLHFLHVAFSGRYGIFCFI